MTGETDFENNQRIPGINEDPGFFVAVSPEYRKQHQNCRHVKKNHQPLKTKDSVSDQGMRSPEKYLSPCRIDGGIIFAIDMRIYCVIP